MVRRIVSGVTLGVAVCGAVSVTDGCLTRPVVSNSPITNTYFITSIPTGSIDKVDLLFDIDNSASMGDKQAYLSQAIPDLVTRLVTPNCVDANGNIAGPPANLDGTCPMANATPEFPPVHNLHLGILSSSLGPRLGDHNGSTNVCPTAAQQTLAGGGMIDRHNDDQAHLLNRSADQNVLTNYTESPLGDATDAAGDNFLNWFPMTAANAMATSTGPSAVTSTGTLNTDFEKLVVGVHQFGCGVESQLETWYRFLIQPDPYASLSVDNAKPARAHWDGVDTTILAQRADFLRPDSLVAILVLTDENDSEVDVRSFNGTAWNFMDPGFNPPRGTSSCQSGDPAMVNSSACTSCGFEKNPNDPSCMTNVPEGGAYGVYASPVDWGMDLNLRHVHEKEKYGVSVQFPIERYVLGLTSPKVPNRDGEYPPDGSGDGGYASSYQGLDKNNLTCTNPLFAAKLPSPPPGSGTWNPSADDLCKLPPGTRKSSLIYYAHIGGVPHQLLQKDPTDPNSPQKDTLTSADWTLILGNDPEHQDYTGIDPHMFESYKSRVSTVPVPSNGFRLSDTGTAEGSDPINGREWETDSTVAGSGGPLHIGLSVDREYACIFKLETPDGAPAPRQCDPASVLADPTLNDSCDCTQPNGGGTYTQAQLPAVCNDMKQTQQDYAKAYPTTRELLLAKLLGEAGNGANSGIVSSLCPIHTADNPMHNDPLYGYRPAMNAIINALKTSLTPTCLPQRLKITAGQVPCLVLGTFPSGETNPLKSCADANPPGTPMGNGYSDPDPTVLAHFKADQHAAYLQGGSLGDDPSMDLTCVLQPLPPNVDCLTNSSETGWCYIDDGSVKGCTQAILFTPSALKNGVTTSLQCLEASTSILDTSAALPGTGTTPAAGDAGH